MNVILGHVLQRPLSNLEVSTREYNGRVMIG